MISIPPAKELPFDSVEAKLEIIHFHFPAMAAIFETSRITDEHYLSELDDSSLA